MNREEILNSIEVLDGACFDMPWEGDFYSTVLKHGGGKWFGVILKASQNYFERYGAPVPGDRTVLNLKCPPDLQIFLREKYPFKALPAYHMNKTHWISVVLDSNVPDEEIFRLIRLSYDMTK